MHLAAHPIWGDISFPGVGGSCPTPLHSPTYTSSIGAILLAVSSQPSRSARGPYCFSRRLQQVLPWQCQSEDGRFVLSVGRVTICFACRRPASHNTPSKGTSCSQPDSCTCLWEHAYAALQHLLLVCVAFLHCDLHCRVGLHVLMPATRSVCLLTVLPQAPLCAVHGRGARSPSSEQWLHSTRSRCSRSCMRRNRRRCNFLSSYLGHCRGRWMRVTAQSRKRWMSMVKEVTAGRTAAWKIEAWCFPGLSRRPRSKSGRTPHGIRPLGEEGAFGDDEVGRGRESVALGIDGGSGNTGPRH